MTCDCSRRDLLKVGSGGLLAMLFSGKLGSVFGQEQAARAKACIFLFMYGGPSHIDTWDPKPKSPCGGTFRPIRTKAGYEICEHMPEIAKVSTKISIIRSMTSKEVDHGRGAYYLRTGYRPQESVEHPPLGSIFAKELARDDADVPPFVTISPGFDTGLGAGLLGEVWSPFILDTPGEVPSTLACPDILSEERQSDRLRLLEEYEKRFGEQRMEGEAALARSLHQKAARYRKGPLRRALDLSREEDSVREAYGKNDGGYTPFGQSCLTARRLVESGVKFVEITHQGWDTHENNFDLTRDLCRETDAGFAALVRDLDRRGVLDSTLIVWAGEFGRTPNINAQGGRDHHGDVFSIALAGGGIRGGLVVGASDPDGSQVQHRAVTFPEVMATAAALAGLNPEKEYSTPEERPIKLVDDARPIRELIS